jgi:hypothetical protein
MVGKLDTKTDHRNALRREVPFIGLKPFSHNIVGILLQSAASKWGNPYANKLIDDFQLESLGWQKVI